MNMCIITAHAGADSLKAAISSWTGCEYKEPEYGKDSPLLVLGSRPLVAIVNGRDGMLPAFQYGFENTSSEILAYFHDDLLLDSMLWPERVLFEFEDPTVGVVGFGGATGHGDPAMYRKPYDYRQLARNNFMSNMKDAEAHGKRFTEECDVAVLDGFALIVRRELLEKAGGWPLKTPIGYICYDYWLCCMARRLGYRIRLVGVPCTHLGGQTFVKLGIGKDPKHWKQYEDSHRYIYDEFKDVLPYEVPR